MFNIILCMIEQRTALMVHLVPHPPRPSVICLNKWLINYNFYHKMYSEYYYFSEVDPLLSNIPCITFVESVLVFNYVNDK